MAPTDEKLAQLQAITGVSVDVARDYLEAFNGDIEAAAQSILEDHDEGADADEPAASQVPADYAGPRTLDGRPVLEAQGGSKKSTQGRSQPKRRGVATLSSFGGGGHGHSNSDDDDDDEDPNDRGDLFAGGEKSGLAVKDPSRGENRGEGSRRIVQDIIAKAKRQARGGAPDDDEGLGGAPSRSWGTGHTLGGEGVESRTIPDPLAAAAQARAQVQARANLEPQERTIHLWRDGFSFEDGPLFRFDDPANQETLDLIRSGRAPLHLMNVQLGQPVNARLTEHDENWRQLPPVYRPFGGEGRRLGSPVPGDGSAMPPPPTSQPAPSAPQASSSAAPDTGANASQPTVALRIQLPDGTRLPARFNTTQTVGDVYDFVTRAHPATQSRAFVVATTFPNKDHTDRALVLGEMAEFKKGGTAVIKWT